MLSKSSILFLALSTCSVKAATDCFTVVGNGFSKLAYNTHRVSVGKFCANSTSSATNDMTSDLMSDLMDDPSCIVSSEGWVTEARTLNITTSSTNKIFDAVKQAVGKPFNKTITGAITGSNFTLEGGSGGYATFTTYMGCFNGTLGDCIGGDIKAGRAIEACTPMTLDNSNDKDGFPSLNGLVQFHEANASAVADLTTNPAATKPSKPSSTATGSGTATASPTPSHTNAALRLGFGGGAAGIVFGSALFALSYIVQE